MENIQLAYDLRVGFKKFPGESLGGIKSDKQVKPFLTEPVGAFFQDDKSHAGEKQHGHRFIQLHRMPRYAVTKIHAPRQTRRSSEGIIRQAGEKTAPASHGNAYGQRENPYGARGAFNTMPPFEEFDKGDPADDRAQDTVPYRVVKLQGQVGGAPDKRPY